MFAQAGGAANGNPQHLTMADYTLSFSCVHDTTPIFLDPDFDLPEQPVGEGLTNLSHGTSILENVI